MSGKDVDPENESVGRAGAPQGSSWGEPATQGSAFGSILGYIPAAASRLKALASSRDVNAIHDRLEGFSRKSRGESQFLAPPGRRLDRSA